MKKTIAAMLLVFAASSAAPAFAAEQTDQATTQQKTMMHGKHHKGGMMEKCMGMMSKDKMKNLPPYAQDFMKSNMKMHKEMMIKPSGSADIDFVRGMIAHHKGAIDMSKVELKYGKDPEMKKLAQNIISAQEKEIKEMETWLKKHEKQIKKQHADKKASK